jgi:hypothetical protein
MQTVNSRLAEEIKSQISDDKEGASLIDKEKIIGNYKREAEEETKTP